MTRSALSFVTSRRSRSISSCAGLIRSWPGKSCAGFDRRLYRRPRPVLGMSEDSFLVRPYRVVGLDGGSSAAAAGLLDGDEILSFTGVHERIAHSASNVRVDATVGLRVRRGEQTLRLSFSTEGPVIDEYVWSLRRGRDRGCAPWPVAHTVAEECNRQSPIGVG